MFQPLNLILILLFHQLNLLHLLLAESPKIKAFSFPSDIDTSTPFVSASCILSKGSKPISFEWRKDGRSLSNGGRLAIRHEDQFTVLEMRDINAKDVGNYTCIATNTFGSDRYTSSLLIKSSSTWTQEPKSITALVSQNLSWHCQASGIPLPSVKWEKRDGNQWKQLDSQKVTIETESAAILAITSVSRNDQGNYRCTSSNGIGKELIKQVFLRVKGE